MNAEKIIKSSQEQATAAWLDYLNQVRINQVVQDLSTQNDNLKDASEVLKKTLHTINSEIIEKNRGGPKGEHGFIAEVAECGIGNAYKKLVGKPENYTWINNNSPSDLQRGNILIQQKFVRSGGLFSLNAIQDHYNKYPDYLNGGSKYQIPRDFYNNVVKLMGMSEKEAYHNLSKTGELTTKQWRKVHEFFEESNITLDDIEPSDLSYGEVQVDAIEHTIGKRDEVLHKESNILKERDMDIGRASLEEAAQAGIASAAIEGGTTFCLELAKKLKAGKKIRELTDDDWKEILEKSGISVVKGGIRGTSIYMITNLTTFFIDMEEVKSVTTTPAAVASAVVTAGFGVAEQVHLFRQGHLSELDLIENSEILCLDAAASAVSSLLGQTIIPVPVLGAVIGNAVGTALYQIAKESFLDESKFYEKYIREQNELNRKLDNQYKAVISNLNDAIMEYYILLGKAFVLDPKESFEGSVELAKNLGIPSSELLTNMEAIDDYFLN